ncbi:MAG: response regulator transcription factor [Calditrichaeota bacterium]|nr:response regulator transcription factor [Calditrichota bacterium]
MRILLVEDDAKVARFIRNGLKEEGFAVDVAEDGKQGLDFARDFEYDVIILDILLPKLDGISVLKAIRTHDPQTPILMLTAMDTLEDKVRGLNKGADDYLTKPFAFEELLARIRALLRRKYRTASTLLRFSDLRVDLVTHQVFRGDREIQLTPKEFALLEYFLQNPNKILTRTMISEHVWDYHFDPETNVIDVYMNYLRNKIDRDFSTKLIHTIRGVGYMLKVES